MIKHYLPWHILKRMSTPIIDSMKKIHEIITMLFVMNHPEGGFYTAEDADSRERRVSYVGKN